MTELRVADFGVLDYARAVALQEALWAAVRDGAPEVVLIGEHPSTMSFGRRSPPVDDETRAVLAMRGIACARSDRGGATTWHGPGQLVLYPVVHLADGVVRHAERLAGAAIAVAAELGVVGRFDRHDPGVWVGERKLASIGLRVRRRIATHGLSLNVDCDLASFSILPMCGRVDLPVTSLQAEGAAAAEEWDIRARLATAYCEALGRRKVSASLPDLEIVS